MEYRTISHNNWKSCTNNKRCPTAHTRGGNSVRKIDPTFDCFGKVVIEDWAYIGSFSQIMPGVTIGEGSLVAAGSVVTKSTPPGSVVGGNPAKIICTVENYLHRNKNMIQKQKG